MKIMTLWDSSGDDEMPWLVAAYDEYTEEAHDGVPDFYTEKKKPQMRELVIEIPESAVTKLFKAPTIKGKVE